MENAIPAGATRTRSYGITYVRGYDELRKLAKKRIIISSELSRGREYTGVCIYFTRKSVRRAKYDLHENEYFSRKSFAVRRRVSKGN